MIRKWTRRAAHLAMAASGALCLVTGPAAGQQALTVDRPAALHAALQKITTTGALDSLRQALVPEATPTAPARRVALGLIELRRHSLTDRIEDAQRAFNDFFAAAEADTTQAWAFFGIGMTVARRPAVLFESPGILDQLLPPRRMAGGLGFEPRSRAQQALLQALLLDPGIESAAMEIADMAVVSQDPKELEIAGRALKQVTETTDVAPEVWLALSRVRNLMADASAANTAAMLAARTGADASLAAYASAVSLLTSPVTEAKGAEAYFRGAHQLTDAGEERYRRDVAQVLDRDELDEFDALPLDEKAGWLEDYWAVRAALAGQSVPRTLGQHYRKVLRADRMYGGVYGEPTPVEAMIGSGEFFPTTVASEFSADLDYYFDFFQFSAGGGRTAVTTAVAVPIDQLRPMLADSQVVYGVRLSAMVIDTLNRTVSRVDTVQYFKSARLAPAESFLRTYVELTPLPSNKAVYRLVVRDAAAPGTGRFFGGGLRVRDFGAEPLELSDLVVAPASQQGSWSRGGYTLPLTPATPFERGAEVKLFYEVYGLPDDAPYRTEIRIEPKSTDLLGRIAGVFRPGSHSLRIAFEGRTPADAGTAVREVRTLSARLQPDDYRLTVVVTDLNTGRSARSTRDITFVDSE